MRGRGLVCDDQSCWMYGFHSCALGGNSLLAEANTVRDVLHLVWSWGHKDVICKVVYADLLASLEDKEIRRFRPLLNEIKYFLGKEWTMFQSRTLRERE